jgi:DNA-binding winged helix-turn-helix (wHTH) protein/tetratricopeptide (TPR) repeat protein
MTQSTFYFGEWQINPDANTLQKGRRQKQVEPKAMDVLLYLCRHAGEVISAETLLSECWSGIDTGDNPLHKTINQLRRALDDSATSPVYIETIRKRGYRTLAEVRFPIGHEQSVAPQQWQGDSPFPGLRAYTAADAKVFFGRSEQIQLLLERIAQQVRFGRDFCLVLGPSGSGKSSLIHAGIVPNLMSEQGANGLGLLDHATLDLADVQAGDLLLSLASTMLDWELNDAPIFAGESASTLAAKLLEPATLLVGLQPLLQHTQYGTARFGLFIDRLEVLLSSPLFSDDERQQFVDMLEQLAHSRAILVLSACRNDFYPQLMSYPSLRAGKGSGAHFDLAPPGRQELLQMIRLPAVSAGLSWQQDPDTAMPLDEILCADAASNPDALPLLQYTLQQLYLQRAADGTMQIAVYQALGGIEGAIGKTADALLASLGEPEQQALSRVLSLLVTLREDEQSITSRSARWDQLQTEAEKTLVQAMVEQRLFVSSLNQQQAGFHVAHEALLRRWPKAVAWINQHKDSLAQRARLYHQSRRWLAEHKSGAFLLVDGKPLQQAQLLTQNPLFTLDAGEQQFVHASTQRAFWRRWTRRSTVMLLCVLTVISVTMSLRSQQAQQQATARRLDAENLLGFMVGDFADKLRSIGRMDLLDGISNKALEYFTAKGNIQDKTLGFEGRFQHGQTLEAIGEVAYSRGKTDEAKNALLAAQQEFLPLLDEQPNNLELLKSLGANAFWQGQLLYDQSNLSAAVDYLNRYLNYSKKMVDIAPDSKESLMELSYALNSLGSVQLKLKHFQEAKTLFEQSLTQKAALLAADPSNQSLVGDIADTRSWLASALVAEGDDEAAIKVWESIRSDFDKPEYKDNAYVQMRISSAMQWLGQYYFIHDEADKSLMVLNEALVKISLELAQDNNNSIWLEDFSTVNVVLFYFLNYSGEYIPKVYFDRVHSILKFANKDNINYRILKQQVVFFSSINNNGSKKSQSENIKFDNYVVDNKDYLNSYAGKIMLLLYKKMKMYQ